MSGHAKHPGMTRAELSVAIRKSFGAHFSLEIEYTFPAGITILFGASGSGKSTLLNCIAGLERPETGRIALGGQVLFDAAGRIDVRAARRGIGYLFQTLALFPHMSIRRNIAYGLAGTARG